MLDPIQFRRSHFRCRLIIHIGSSWCFQTPSYFEHADALDSCRPCFRQRRSLPLPGADGLRARAAAELRRGAAAGRRERPFMAERGCVRSKRVAPGQMQTPAEMVPISDASRIVPATSGCVGISNFGEFWQNSGNFGQCLN